MSEYTGQDQGQFMRPVTCLSVQPGSKQCYEASYMSEYTGRDLGQVMTAVTKFSSTWKNLADNSNSTKKTFKKFHLYVI